MKRTAFIAYFLLLLLQAKAQTDTLDLVAVEVRSLRASEKAPFAKTNVSKEALEKQNGGQDLPFLLQRTPSVVVSSDAGNGIGYTGIRIRGSDATRINVTLNGIPFNDPESGGTFFVNLPDIASSISSIQVQRGVGSSSNGAGAFGASINLSTHEKTEKAYLELANSYGSFHSLKNTLRFGSGLLGNRFTVDGRLSRITSDGYIDRARTDLKSYYLSTAYLKNKTSIRFTTFSGKEETYQAWYGVSEKDLLLNRRTNTAGTERSGEPYDNETDNYTQNHYQAFLNQQLGKNLVFNTGLFLVRGKGYYEQYKADETYSDYGMVAPIMGLDTAYTTDLVRQLWLDNYFYGSVYSLNYKKGGTALTLGGAATAYDGAHFGEVIWAQNGLDKNGTWYRNKGEKNDANIFLKWQQSISPVLSLYTDLQWRGVRHAISGFRNNPDVAVDQRYDFFNPKIGLSLNKNGWTGFASYSIANKEPNRDDFETGVNRLPKPEHLQDLEVGFERRAQKFTAAVTAYYMKYRDQLVLTGQINDVGAYTRTNIGDSYRTGIELEGTAALLRWMEASANLTLSRNRISDFTEYVDDYDNGGQKETFFHEAPISFSPAVTANANLFLKPFAGTEINLLSTYVGDQYLDNTGNASRKLKGYYTQDVRVLQTVKTKRLEKLTLIGQVTNVFNKLYEPNGYTFSYYYGSKLITENYYFPMSGTAWMLGVNVRL